MEQKIEKIKQEYVRQYLRYSCTESTQIKIVRGAKLYTLESVLLILGVKPWEVLREEKLID